MTKYIAFSFSRESEKAIFFVKKFTQKLISERLTRAGVTTSLGPATIIHYYSPDIQKLCGLYDLWLILCN
jgi:hypothetical protein